MTKSTRQDSSSPRSSSSALVLGVGGHGNLDEGNVVASGQCRAGVVVAHHRHDVQGQVSRIATVEQFREAMVVLRDHHECAPARVLATDRQLRVEGGERRLESTADDVQVVGVGLEARPHAELRRDGVGELIVLQDVAADPDDRGRGRQDDAWSIDALQGDDDRRSRSPFGRRRAYDKSSRRVPAVAWMTRPPRESLRGRRRGDTLAR